MPDQPTSMELRDRIAELEKEVSALQRTVRELRETESRYESIFRSALDAFLIFDSKGRIVHANPEALRMYGYSLDELTRLTGRDIVHPDHYDIFIKFKKGVKEDGFFETESLDVRKDGTTLAVEVRGAPFDYAGERHLLAMVRNISKRKEAEEALKKTDKRLTLALEAMSDGLWDWDVEEGNVYRSPGWFFMLGYKPGELPATVETWSEAIHPDDRDRVMRAFQAHLKRETPAYECEYRFRMKNGQWKWIIDRARVVERDEEGNPLRMVGAHTDIHKRKQAEVALQRAYDELEKRVEERTEDLARANEKLLKEIREREHAERDLREANIRLEALINATPDIVYFKDIHGRNMIVNRSYEELVDLRREEVLGKTDSQIFPPELAEATRRSDEETIRLAEPYHLEETTTDAHGAVRHFDTIKVPIYDEKGNLQGLVGVSRDITARKQAEAALRESEERFRKFADEVAFEGLIIHEKGNILDVNQSFARIFGYERTELIGMDALDTISPESREVVRRNMERRHEISYEAMARRKDGTPFPIEIRDKTIPFHGKSVRAAAVRDLSQQKLVEAERQRLEAAFRESHKMEAIGTLAGGIAHEFNNLLMGIQGNTSLMLLDLEPTHPHYKRLKSVEQQIVSGAELTKQLIGFARGGKYEVRQTNLNELLQTTSRMFGRTRKEITIHRHYQEDIWTVDVDRGQIEQALLSLYVNAWQAMPSGGVITIETKNTILEEKDVATRLVPPGRYVNICVTDTGISMDKTTLERIFDPFYTTLEMGRGSGLGLAAVYGIIKNHGGFVTVSSERGEGTTFHLFLPASKERSAEAEKPVRDTVKGQETILLVDDEAIVLEVGRDMLEALGYRVYVAPNGESAIRLYREHGERIDLVILDMIMPSMGGGETFDRLKEMDPVIKVILSTGYSIDGEATEILQRGCDGFIQKPFNIKDLSRKIREVLEVDRGE